MYPWSEIFRHWLYSLVSRVLWRCIALDCESMFGSILSWESCETCVKGDSGSPVRISCNLRMSHWCCQPVAMLTSLRTIQVMSIWAPNLCESRSVDMSFQGEFFFYSECELEDLSSLTFWGFVAFWDLQLHGEFCVFCILFHGLKALSGFPYVAIQEIRWKFRKVSK